MQIFVMGVGAAILVVAAQGVAFLPAFLGQRTQPSPPSLLLAYAGLRTRKKRL